MHMVATNLCEWLYVLVEETKHEIWHLSHAQHSDLKEHHTHEAMATIRETFNHTSFNETNADHTIIERSTTAILMSSQDCQRTNIMGSLVQNASPFLFPVINFALCKH